MQGRLEPGARLGEISQVLRLDSGWWWAAALIRSHGLHGFIPRTMSASQAFLSHRSREIKQP